MLERALRWSPVTIGLPAVLFIVARGSIPFFTLLLPLVLWSAYDTYRCRMARFEEPGSDRPWPKRCPCGAINAPSAPVCRYCGGHV